MDGVFLIGSVNIYDFQKTGTRRWDTHQAEPQPLPPQSLDLRTGLEFLVMHLTRRISARRNNHPGEL